MKLDQNKITDVIKNVDLSKIEKQVKDLDINIDSDAIQKLFNNLDVNKAQKAMEILNAESVKKSIKNIKKFEGFSGFSGFSRFEGFIGLEDGVPKVNSEGIVDYNQLEKIISDFNLKKMTKPNKDYTVNPTTTISDRFQASKEYILELKNNIEAMASKIKTKTDISRTLDNVKTIYDNETNKIKKIYKKDLKKKMINKRLIEFYDKDASVKKTMIRYLKYIYFVFIGLFVITIFYKNRYKDKKLYGVLLLLFLIPGFLIKKMYNVIINIVGHTKLDLLYTFMLSITTILIIGLFFIFKYSLKNTDDNINLLNIAKVTNSIKDKIQNKTKNLKNKITGDNNQKEKKEKNKDFGPAPTELKPKPVEVEEKGKN